MSTDRAIRTLIASALARLEAETGATIRAVVKPGTVDRWRRAIAEPRAGGQTQQSWLWAPPAKHSTRPLTEVLERIKLLYRKERLELAALRPYCRPPLPPDRVLFSVTKCTHCSACRITPGKACTTSPSVARWTISACAYSRLMRFGLEAKTLCRWSLLTHGGGDRDALQHGHRTEPFNDFHLCCVTHEERSGKPQRIH